MTFSRHATDVRRQALFGLGLFAAFGLGGCERPAGPAQQEAGGKGGAQAAEAPCPGAALASPMPRGAAGTEAGVDCFAWQTFLALNWRADPNKPGYPDPAAAPDSFGTPGDTSPAVWETYLEAAQVFGPRLQGSWQARRPAVKPLSRTSKFGRADLTDITQAGSGHHWLTSQRGEITYYEVMMNRDEYEFITDQKFDLTTAAGQLACATQRGKPVSDGTGNPQMRGGLTFPEGQSMGWDDTDCEGNIRPFGDKVGAMEIKAAWTPLPDNGPHNHRYKTALAEIRDPVTGKMRNVTVGLVGLHIARKPVGFHQWIWATFEQIDNSPDEGADGTATRPVLPAPRPAAPFTFFNPGCTPDQDPTYRCRHNAPPRPCGTSGIVCDPYDKPMQITRLNPVGATANQVTAQYWSLLPKNSVFNYYRLIGVQWPQKAGKPLSPGQRLPLPQGDPMPAGAKGGVKQILANTTLESFQQSSDSCMDCHANFARIAPLRLRTNPRGLRPAGRLKAGEPAPYASDYSFIFVTETQR